MSTTTARKTGAKYIVIEWSEADSVKAPRYPLACATWEAAEQEITRIRQYDREHGPGFGYCKTGFRIIWDDGENYEGRIDVQAGTIETLQEHVRTFNERGAGISKPYRYSQAEWDQFLTATERHCPGHRAACQRILDTYRIGD